MEPSAPTTSTPAPNDAQESVREEDILIAFDTYPWDKDPKFMTLIRNSLQKPSTVTPEAKIRHARIAYFTRVLGFPLSIPSYDAFLAARPSHSPPEAVILAVAQGTPAWQVTAPKADLFVDKAARESGEGPAYPGRFAELIQCIKEGRPVPGVKEIPDTILRDPAAKPFGSRAAPRKPWETDEGADGGGAGAGPGAMDQEFPPLETTGPSGEEAKTAA